MRRPRALLSGKPSFTEILQRSISGRIGSKGQRYVRLVAAQRVDVFLDVFWGTAMLFPANSWSHSRPIRLRRLRPLPFEEASNDQDHCTYVICLAGLGAIAGAAIKSTPPLPEIVRPVVAGNKADRLPLA